MKYSIITICYNDPDVEATCKSIAEQTFQDFEWVVIDGASNEATLKVFEKYKNRIDTFVSEPDIGIYNAMNKGIRLTKGEYLLFMNAGDILFENSVLEKINNENFKEDIVYCDAMSGTDPKAWQKLDYSSANLNKEYFINKTLHHQSTLIKRELFEKYGYYNEKHKIVSDWEKWIEFIIINKCSTRYLNLICGCNEANGISCKKECSNILHKEKMEVLSKYYTKEEIKSLNKPDFTFIEQIFSLKNVGEYKIITLLGMHIKIKKQK